IKKIIFNSGKFIVVGNTENEEYSLSDIRYLSFQPLSANHISENKTGTSVLIFPNPVEKEVTVEAQEAITSILLYDINGKIIRQFSSLSSSVTLNLTDLPSGYYLIKIETANVCLIRKIIKK
ncbi:MAG: T9SS type A sorting domain-containing protein, partial [Candidatus Azobacteroides sp.]|nr:T9SS type A sorting domain-containing protein [Candidatus Azobacteroides sp.]